MAIKNLNSHIEILGRYTRSIEIERDYGDINALDGYILTPQGAGVLSNLLDGLSNDSHQRAWILSGHYGVGKSALSLLLISIMCRLEGKFSTKVKKIYSQYPDLKKKAQNNFSYDTVLVSGAKNQFSKQLIASMKSKIDAMIAGAGRPPAVLKAATVFLEKIEHDSLDDFSAIEIFDQFLDYWKKHAPAGKRLLLVIDEMGTVIEHMASYQDKNAPAIFQYLAEKSAGSGPMSILGIAHRNIYEYATEWDKETLKEWSRIADRFEHISLQGSVEHVMYLLRQSITLDAKKTFLSQVTAKSKLIQKNYFSGEGVEKKVDFENIFPIHPATAILLRSVTQRFQQSDRSFFSFLMSSEPGGLQEFISKMPAEPESWYRVEHLSQFILNGGLRVADIDRRRKIVTLEDVVNNPLPDATENSVLKTIAVMDALQPIVDMPVTAEIVSWAIEDDRKSPEVRAAIERLVKKGYIHQRHHDGKISVWVRGGVNLALEFEKISMQQNVLSTESILPILTDWHYLQSHRHYLETGHLRQARVELIKYSSDMPIPDTSQTPVIQLVLVNNRHPRQMVIKDLRKHSNAAGDNLLLHACFLGNYEWLLLKNWSIWKSILENSEQIQADEIACVEVQSQKREHEKRIKKLLGLDGAFKRSALFKKTWFRSGKLEKIENMRQFQHLLSDMMMEMYHSAPVIKNELINRPKLSTAISSARNRLIECMLESPEQEDLGMRDGFPPEKLIYESLLKRSGIHRRSELTGKIGLSVPVASIDKQFALVWQVLDKALYGDDCRLSAKQLVKELTLPPFGLNEQMSTLLVAFYMITAWDKLSVMEKGSLQLSANKEMFLRFFKNPANFDVKRHVDTNETENILKSYALVSVFCNIKSDAHPVISVAREIYGWYNQLPEYSKRTPLISEKANHFRAVLERAREPHDLVMKTIPQLIMDNKKGDKRKGTFADLLNSIVNELDNAYVNLMNNIIGWSHTSFGKDVRSPAEFQNYLEREFSDISSIISGKEKIFYERCCRSTDDSMEWFAGIASAIMGIHPQKWQEQHETAFPLEIRSLALGLQRKKAFALDGNKLADSCCVYLIYPDGKEAAFILDAPPDMPQDSQLLSEILTSAKDKGIDNFDHALVHFLREREQRGVAVNE